MKTALFILECWAALLFIGGPIYLALLKTKHVRFHENVERSRYDRGWGPRP